MRGEGTSGETTATLVEVGGMAPPVSPPLQWERLCHPGRRRSRSGCLRFAPGFTGLFTSCWSGKDGCSLWEIWVKFLDNCLKAAVHGETAGVFSPSQNLCVLKANNKHIILRFYGKIQWRNAIMRELAAR